MIHGSCASCVPWGPVPHPTVGAIPVADGSSSAVPLETPTWEGGQAEFTVSRSFSVHLGGGISSYAGDHGGAASSLTACLEEAVRVIPKSRHHQTPLHLGATAGMRLLESVKVPHHWMFHKNPVLTNKTFKLVSGCCLTERTTPQSPIGSWRRCRTNCGRTRSCSERQPSWAGSGRACTAGSPSTTCWKTSSRSVPTRNLVRPRVRKFVWGSWDLSSWEMIRRTREQRKLRTDL